jgi:hypothetical protein
MQTVNYAGRRAALRHAVQEGGKWLQLGKAEPQERDYVV